MSDRNDSRLSQFLKLQARKLQIDLQAARLFVGTTDIGHTTEHAVRKLLSANLPTKYSIGVGEVIAPDGQIPGRVDQTQQKDVIIYDSYLSSVFQWDENGVNLFPAESVYAVIEVKTSISSITDLRAAIEQTLAAKRLCHRVASQSPFTGVFIFESNIRSETLFEDLKQLPRENRADFVFILKPRGATPEPSVYFAHWHYYQANQGSIEFVPVDEVVREWNDHTVSDKRKHLTFGKTEESLLWFYLFLINQLEKKTLEPPKLWDYAGRADLGWTANE